MIYRKLGVSGAEVGVVGLGAEYLEFADANTVASVVDAALDGGVNYIDLFMPTAAVRDNFGRALRGRRHRVMVAGHLGPVLSDGQYCRSRDPAVCQEFFEDLFRRLGTEYIDVLMLHFVDRPDDYPVVFDEAGLLGVARRLKQEGKARFIGMSSHNVPTSLRAVNSGAIDVLMFPVNPAFDIMPDEMEAGVSLKEVLYRQAPDKGGKGISPRQQLYHACAARGVGVVAMKPYAAGVLFRDNPSSILLTPAQCLHYALSQPAVCTAVPGCKNAGEMKAALAYLEAGEAEKDYSAINMNVVWKLKGSCMYCNHCLPCPAGIDIGTVTRLADTAGFAMNDEVASDYGAMEATASACSECAACMERCPFGVDVIANMNRAVELFGR